MPIVAGILAGTLWFGTIYIPILPKRNSNVEKFKDLGSWQLSPKSLLFQDLILRGHDKSTSGLGLGPQQNHKVPTPPTVMSLRSRPLWNYFNIEGYDTEQVLIHLLNK